MRGLLKKLRRVNKIPSVNYGGCGIVAKFLHQKAIAVRPDVSIWYLVSHRDHPSLEECAKAISSTTTAPVHVVVKIGDWWYDSNGEHDETAFSECYLVQVSYEHLLTILAIRKEWNHCFDRRKTPTIRKILLK